MWCEGEYLGKIEGLAPELHELVTHYETLGLVSVIRCYVSEDGTAATAELLAPEEISEAVLEPPVSPIPTTDLPYPQSSATGTESNAAEHGGASSPDSEGNWSLRLPSSRFFAPTPEQIREHKEKIRVKSPSLPESSAPSEATTMFQAQPKQQPVVGVGSYQQRDNHPEPQPDSSASGSSRSWWWLLAILVLILLASTLFILSRF
ncbi:hypothetical protein GP475_04460 [Corynebacterium poyangense]|uniref:Uncharacterized protein n=1 Tax=Corynebacterium poyangense TaxID=2684405 RepID=A0A7H0SN52_9CORY|nr:hypothetical protein [Corynebacterium poyangense]QNQ89977.1 hypothetical protein GP475_04460 [Corynebacterium poyangense]